MSVADDVIAQLAFGTDGLVPAIAQQHDTGEILMFAWMNAEAARATINEGRAVYFSRSRDRLWRPFRAIVASTRFLRRDVERFLGSVVESNWARELSAFCSSRFATVTGWGCENSSVGIGRGVGRIVSSRVANDAGLESGTLSAPRG